MRSARPESSGKWSSKLYKTPLATTFMSFGSSLPLCKQHMCLTWLTKSSTRTHPTALPGRRLCICEADTASGAGTGFIKTQKSSTSKNTTCFMQYYFVISKLRYCGNETEIPERLKNSRNLWVVRIFVDFFKKAVLESQHMMNWPQPSFLFPCVCAGRR